jgi:hypothetical protein
MSLSAPSLTSVTAHSASPEPVGPRGILVHDLAPYRLPEVPHERGLMAPSVSAVVAALEQAYEERGDPAVARDCRDHAAAYDADQLKNWDEERVDSRIVDIGEFLRLQGAVQSAIEATAGKPVIGYGRAAESAYLRMRNEVRQAIPEEDLGEFDRLFPTRTSRIPS